MSGCPTPGAMGSRRESFQKMDSVGSPDFQFQYTVDNAGTMIFGEPSETFAIILISDIFQSNQ
jgi:hypothetical protein